MKPMKHIQAFNKNDFFERFGISVDKHRFRYFREHTHNFYEFEYILDGTVQYTIDNQTRVCRKHDLIYASPLNSHRYDELQGYVTTVTVHFTEEVLKDLLGLSKTSGCVIYAPELEGLFLSMLDEYENIDEFSFLGLSNLLERCVILFLREYKKLQNSSKFNNKTNIEGYVFTHFREKLTLDGVSGYFGYSPSYFSKLFKKTTGLGFSTYLNDCRLNYAYSLLKMGDMSVSEICFSSGFNCLRNFNRSFLNKYGISPSEVKK